jgi:hypothetical protein
MSAARRRRVAAVTSLATLVVVAAATVPVQAAVPEAARISGAGGTASIVTTTTTTVTDPDDVHGRFDIKRVVDVVRHVRGRPVRVSYTVTTYPTWVEPRLDRNDRTFVLQLNRDAERGSEVNVTVSKRSGHIAADLISNSTRRVIRSLEVSRPDDRSFRISGSRRLLGARSYFWTSNFHTVAAGSLCGRRHGYPVTCQDSVPDSGWIQMSPPAWPKSPLPRSPRSQVPH